MGNKVRVVKENEFIAGIWLQSNPMFGGEYTWTLSNTKAKVGTGGVAKTIDEAEQMIAEAKSWLGKKKSEERE